ncbi:MAG: hypothetical protein CR986_01660 [Ignavibacteriae bacterium]|nr:MAG: hypothetical protein CR986_01660 [Ignavibacteriota bacterium]
MIKEYSDKDFWKNYMINWFGYELIEKWEEYVEVKLIDSVQGKINIEIYKNIDIEKPTIVFSHGIAGYARVLLPFLIPLFEKGYNIIAPDLEGFGYNNRLKGDFTWNIHLENLKDTIDFARTIFKGKIFLGGASMGGPLAYATDVRYNCADGLICWCLWDFADREFMNKETTTKRFTYPMMPVLKFSSRLFGKLRLKTYSFISYDTLTDRSQFNNLLKTDPQAGTLISLRGVLSLLTQSKPDKNHNEYKKPVLVCQPEQDKMIPSYYTKKTFKEIKSDKKQYCSFEGAHFPIDKKNYEKWADCVDRFIKENEK